jgi:hypothetical protein
VRVFRHGSREYPVQQEEAGNDAPQPPPQFADEHIFIREYVILVNPVVPRPLIRDDPQENEMHSGTRGDEAQSGLKLQNALPWAIGITR